MVSFAWTWTRRTMKCRRPTRIGWTDILSRDKLCGWRGSRRTRGRRTARTFGTSSARGTRVFSSTRGCHCQISPWPITRCQGKIRTALTEVAACILPTTASIRVSSRMGCRSALASSCRGAGPGARAAPRRSHTTAGNGCAASGKVKVGTEPGATSSMMASGTKTSSTGRVSRQYLWYWRHLLGTPSTRGSGREVRRTALARPTWKASGSEL
mmetsp:Transcript_28727/g.95407  ORF Transcript_28727/g.95407 Transcript_28727/m.95407 type:complete len:212 (-) Transcript_28727:1424-2059(-)